MSASVTGSRLRNTIAVWPFPATAISICGIRSFMSRVATNSRIGTSMSEIFLGSIRHCFMSAT